MPAVSRVTSWNSLRSWDENHVSFFLLQLKLGAEIAQVAVTGQTGCGLKSMPAVDDFPKLIFSKITAKLIAIYNLF